MKWRDGFLRATNSLLPVAFRNTPLPLSRGELFIPVVFYGLKFPCRAFFVINQDVAHFLEADNLKIDTATDDFGIAFGYDNVWPLIMYSASHGFNHRLDMSI